MKKTITLILAAALCLALCACGGSADQTATTLSPEALLALERQEAVVNGNACWNCANRSTMTAFLQDGTTASPDGFWDLAETTLTHTLLDGTTKTYELTQIGGQTLLVGQNRVLFPDGTDWDSIPQKAVPVTAENWAEYFEIRSLPLGADGSDIPFLKLKDTCYRALRLSKSSAVTFLCQVNGQPQTLQVYEYHPADLFGLPIPCDAGEFSFEVTEVNGTLCLIEGI